MFFKVVLDRLDILDGTCYMLVVSLFYCSCWHWT